MKAERAGERFVIGRLRLDQKDEDRKVAEVPVSAA
jgi:hypothetical protein